MISSSFDGISREIIKADQTIREEEKEIAGRFSLDTFILTFSYKLVDLLLEQGEIEVLDERLTIGSSAFKNPIYKVKNTSVGFVLSGIGAPMIAAIVEELVTLFHARHYIVFGSCGALVNLPAGKVILPTEAYRDEGTSYHYAPAMDYITVKNAQCLARVFDEIGVGYVKGKTWTTDAFYRETANNKNARVADGCVCVEMECSALQAVCDFRGLELYQFVYAADSLEGEWARRILGELEKDSRLKYFYVAREIAARIESGAIG